MFCWLDSPFWDIITMQQKLHRREGYSMNKNSNFLFWLIELIFGISWRLAAGYLFTMVMIKTIFQKFM